jgi:AcrR family transcriptional regulator
MAGMEAAAARSTDSEARDRIVAAARRTYAHHGVKGTRMAQVAEAAGIARRTLYRFVAGRDELIELAAASRMRELAAVVEDRVDAASCDLTSSLTECLATMIDVLRGDPEAAELIGAMDPAHAFRFMTGPSEAQAPTLHVLEPYYERAREEGALQPGLSLDEMTWWARMFLAPLIARPELNGDPLRSLIRRFALPALIRDS